MKKDSSEKRSKIIRKKRINLSNYPRLNKTKATKARKDLLDYDYLDKLGKEELEFLNQFSDEYYCANFKGDTIHAKKFKKDCEDRNNKRNSDLLTIKEITGGINYTNFGPELDELNEAAKQVTYYSGVEDFLEEMEEAPVSINILKKLTE
jgi:hypothetical protein